MRNLHASQTLGCLLGTRVGSTHTGWTVRVVKSVKKKKSVAGTLRSSVGEKRIAGLEATTKSGRLWGRQVLGT